MSIIVRDKLPDGHPFKGTVIHFFRNPKPATVGSDPDQQAPAQAPKEENDDDQK